MKPKGVNTQMKALDKYFTLFTLLLNRVHVLVFNLDTETWQ